MNKIVAKFSIIVLLPIRTISHSSLIERIPNVKNSCSLSRVIKNSHKKFYNKGNFYLEKREISFCGWHYSKKETDEKFSNSDMFVNDENIVKKQSTFEDVESSLHLIKEIVEFRKKNSSSWIIESKVKKLCGLYKCFLKDHKSKFIQVLACDYAVNHSQVISLSQLLGKYSALTESEIRKEGKILKNEEQLRNILVPEYYWLFLHIGRLEKGVKFLVDLRTDILELIMVKNANGESTIQLQQLSSTLRDLLSLWFSVGFLQLKRITWNSSCELLQKISEYEAVHPVRNWTDLKRRVGPYRRCFVFLHDSMPGEPIVVLHTALCDEISSSMSGIVTARSRMSVDSSMDKIEYLNSQQEDSCNVKAAVFYSITSTQKGLQGIELGNYLIKSVVRELQIEFPHITQFSSLSPIPKFKVWLLEKLKSAEKGQNDLFFPSEMDKLKSCVTINLSDFWREIRVLLHSNTWADNKELIHVLEKPLMRLCARYLFLEKRRGYAFDNVANFHLRNGAMMWRLNWWADLSPRGLGNSCGIMVNYRYFLDETENNSRIYIENQVISAANEIIKLADEAKQLMKVSKM